MVCLKVVFQIPFRIVTGMTVNDDTWILKLNSVRLLGDRMLTHMLNVYCDKIT